MAEGVVSGLPLTGSVGWGGISGRLYATAGTRTAGGHTNRKHGLFSDDGDSAATGRFFSEDDTTEKEQVAIIDEKFAQRFWPNGGAIGKHLWFNPKKPMTIVGVVGVVKQYGLETDGKIATYLPFEQHPGNELFLAVRTSAEEAGLSSALASQIHAVDPNVVVYDIRTCMSGFTIRWRGSAFRNDAGSVAVFALSLAAIGFTV